MYAALDLGQQTIQAVLKSQDGKIANELKIKRQAGWVLKFLKGTNANVVMESEYNYRYHSAIFRKTNLQNLQKHFQWHIRYHSRYDCYHDWNTGLGALACLKIVCHRR